MRFSPTEFTSGLEASQGLQRRASHLLDVQLDEHWSVGRLARVLGVSSRTLHRLMKREFGRPPMSLIREMRLTRARLELETAASGTTVTRAALDCGFGHLGRFSLDYARQFGESPSATLRRARRQSIRGELDLGVATVPANAPLLPALGDRAVGVPWQPADGRAPTTSQMRAPAVP